MATYRSSARTTLQIGAESAYNTPGASGHECPKSSITIPSRQELITSDELQSNPNPVLDSKGINAGAGYQFINPVSCDFFGLMCYFMFGDAGYTVTGAGDPYTHVFKIANTNPDSLYFEIGDSSAAKYDIHKGLLLHSLQLGGEKTSDLLRATWGLTGSGLATINGGTSNDASADTYGDARHILPLMEARVAGSATAYLTGMNLTIQRNPAILMALDGNRYGSDFDLGKFMVDCTLTGWRDSADSLFGLDDDTDKQVSLYSVDPDDATHSIEIEFPESRVLNVEGYSVSGGDAPYPVTAKVSPYYDDNADATAIMITVINGIADYAAL